MQPSGSLANRMKALVKKAKINLLIDEITKEIERLATKGRESCLCSIMPKEVQDYFTNEGFDLKIVDKNHTFYLKISWSDN